MFRFLVLWENPDIGDTVRIIQRGGENFFFRAPMQQMHNQDCRSS